MRAWLLLLAVLATFQPIVQVASTEDITSRFIQAISSPSINQQKQRQKTDFEYVENKRDARNSFNTQQLIVNEEEEKSRHVTAVSPVIDITALSVTKSAASIGARSSASARSNQKSTATTSTSSTTSIATIFSSSDSDNSNNNNKNNLNYKFSAKKDNSASKSENTSDTVKANEIFELSEVKQKHKQIKQQNHNEVNEKSAKNTLVDPTKRNCAVTTQANKVQQQQLENTEESTNSQQESSAVYSEEEKEVERANEQEKELQDLSEMAFKENIIATAQEAREEHSSGSSKRHRHLKKYHRHHQQQEHHQHRHQQHHHHHHHHQQQHQDTQQQHPQKHYKTTRAETKNVTEQISSATEERLAAEERPAAEERLATNVPETPKDRFALPAVEAASSTTHKAAAEKLALDSARPTVNGSSTANARPESSKPASPTANAANTAPINTSTASMSSSDTEVDASRDSVSDESDSDSDSDNEPATYSNKEIIGEKLKPDPSTLVQIENSLLSLFNMKRPPKIDRSKIIIPEAMKQLYAQIMGYELDSVMIPRPGILTKSANTVRSFTHIESKIDDRFPHHHRFRLYFDVKSIPNEEKLRAAELHLSRNAISDAVFNERLANRTRYQVLAYDITRVGVRGKREPSYLLLDNKAVYLNSTETVSLDVQPAVDRWLATPKKNYGLLIEVRTSPSLKPAPHHHVRLRRSVDEPHESWQHKQPVLYTYTDDGKHKSRSIRDASSRSKRAGHHRRAHRRKNSDEICRRHSLYVDFADVGWSDWIVAPPGYDAFYCQGKCPFPLAEHMNSTNHAVVQTLVNNLNPGKVPKACCVPTQLEGISMLYLNDQNTVVLKNYQDMTVVGCGCR